MKPIAIITYNSKKTTYDIDKSSSLFNFVIKQLMAYTLSRDASRLPDNVPIVLLLPKNAQAKAIKKYAWQHFSIECRISDNWTYIWDVDDRDRTGWWFNDEKVNKYNEDKN